MSAMSSGDTGSGQLSAGVPGVSANVTVGHTVLLILGALALLWLFGGVVFKSIRMH